MGAGSRFRPGPSYRARPRSCARCQIPVARSVARGSAAWLDAGSPDAACQRVARLRAASPTNHHSLASKNQGGGGGGPQKRERESGEGRRRGERRGEEGGGETRQVLVLFEDAFFLGRQQDLFRCLPFRWPMELSGEGEVRHRRRQC